MTRARAAIPRAMTRAAASASIRNGLGSVTLRLIGVSMKPGETKVTATPNLFMRSPSASANNRKPALLAA